MGKLAALGIAMFVLFAPLGASGIWDPPELAVAELARRVAIHALGTRELELPGADNSMPVLRDLGANELPVDSIALGFRLFGLSEWAGRLPLSVWGFFGILALYFCLSRLVDQRAGVYGALVLTTMPLYFVQARTMLGDIVTMAGVAMAFAGLSVATFACAGEGDAPNAKSFTRQFGAGLGAIGLVVGFLSRGAMGVVVPALAVGIAWIMVAARGPRADASAGPGDRWGRAFGALSLVIGAAALVGASIAIITTPPGAYSMWLGATVIPPARLPTFDASLHAIGHSLFPWSAFLPFAAGRLFATPATSPESALRAALLIGASAALGLHGLVLPWTGPLPFFAPAILAAMIAVAVRDVEQTGLVSRLTAIGVVLLTSVLLLDFEAMPEKGLSPFALPVSATFPDGFRDPARTFLRTASLIFALVLATAFSWRGVFRSIRISRGSAIVAGGVVAGTVFALGYHPRLAAQLSPREAFEAHARLRQGREELGVLGLTRSSSAYGARGPATWLSDVTGALRWLTADEQRRWLVARREDLARLNSRFRAEAADGRHNLPVLDARSSQILLLSNLLREGETSHNPYERVVLSTSPQPRHPLEANLEDQLICLGWDVRDARTGESADVLVPSHRYRFRIGWKVISPPTREWETFIHIDGPQRRFNGDHATLAGAYAMSLWQSGDVMVDEHEFSLPIHFGPGTYQVFFGLYLGERRMKVKTGRSEGDRIEAGTLEVVGFSLAGMPK